MNNLSRFYDPQADLELGRLFQLNKTESRHAIKVLRLKTGNHAQVFNAKLKEFIVEIKEIQGQVLTYCPIKELTNITDPVAKVTLAFALAKGDKFEWVIQKATELGVAKIIPFTCKRSVPVIHDKQKELKKLERWNSIILAAVKQCGRRSIPELSTIQSLITLFENAESESNKLFLFENESKLKLNDYLRQSTFKSETIIIVGPEGGFTEEEKTLADKQDWHCLSLGTRILRCETAAICAVSLVMSAAGEL